MLYLLATLSYYCAGDEGRKQFRGTRGAKRHEQLLAAATLLEEEDADDAREEVDDVEDERDGFADRILRDQTALSELSVLDDLSIPTTTTGVRGSSKEGNTQEGGAEEMLALPFACRIG